MVSLHSPPIKEVNNRSSQLDDYIGKLFWYRSSNKLSKLEIKIIVRSLEAKFAWGRLDVLVEPVQLNSNLVQIEQKSVWVSSIQLEEITSESKLGR